MSTNMADNGNVHLKRICDFQENVASFVMLMCYVITIYNALYIIHNDANLMKMQCIRFHRILFSDLIDY